ncbi:MAG: hypothetical protein QOF51_518, partial [Chloroflexota bacterium]|nr:hypothetical protein [Chloroflexota bacterium]
MMRHLRSTLLVLLVLLACAFVAGRALSEGLLDDDTDNEQPQTDVSITEGDAPTTVQGPTSFTVAGAWYQLAFTAPTVPDNRAAHHGGLDEQLVDLMNRAQSTMDVAIYDFDLANVAEAMAAAAARGVHVRMVTDTDTFGNTRKPAV